MTQRSAEVLIIGGGIIGITLALELKRRHSDARIVLLEKEQALGEHASGRNSGVLHAGFYYAADSLKARLCRDGNRALSEYCATRGLPIHRCGKLVVARNAAELSRLDELLLRAGVNGVTLSMITAAEARKIEPRARTFERALWSPTTASVDPLRILTALAADADEAGITILRGTAYLGRTAQAVRTTHGDWRASYVINTAGLHADRIARDFGFGSDYRILPFKGSYLYSTEPPHSLRTNIYPVPDLKQPFLGVHLTVTVDGHVKLGPTATPALWRESYEGFSRFSAQEMWEIARLQTRLLLAGGFGFAGLAIAELRKSLRGRLVACAASLAAGVRVEHYRRWGRPGLRAQLVDVRTGRLEMDFRFEGDAQSFHVLNAVSPAFTCAIPFSCLLADEIENRWR